MLIFALGAIGSAFLRITSTPPLGLSEAFALFQSPPSEDDGKTSPSGKPVGDAEGETDGDPDGDDDGTASADDVGDADAEAEGDAPS